jgi:hypothetical protein
VPRGGRVAAGQAIRPARQVTLEFQRRRLDVIVEKEKYLKTTQRDLNDVIKGLRDWV